MSRALDVTLAVDALFAGHDVAAISSDQKENWVSLRSCPACTSSELHLLTSVENRDREPFLQKSVCADCGHVFFSHMPGLRFFDEYYAHRFARNKVTPTATPDYPYTPVSDILDRYIPKNARILDVGCGYGSALKHLAALGYTRLVGLEPSTLRAEVATRSGLEILPIATDGLSRESHGEFDCAYSWHAFEHIYDIDGAIASVKSVLAPEGYLLIAVPHYEAEHIVQIAHFLPHIHNYNERSLQALLGRHGFDIVHLDTSLRVLARLRPDGVAGSPGRVDVGRDLNKKIQRDFDLRGRNVRGPVRAWISMSKYRGSDEILEPSFGELRVSGQSQRLDIEGWVLTGSVTRRMQRGRRLGRVWRSLFGRYITGELSVRDAAGHIPRATFVYPTQSAPILMK